LLFSNVLILFAVAVLNLLSVKIVNESKRKSGRKTGMADKMLVIRTLLVSASNFIGWSVVVPLGVLFLSGYKLNYGIVPWIAILGLPLNSFINPLLYTFSTVDFLKKCQAVKEKLAQAREG